LFAFVSHYEPAKLKPESQQEGTRRRINKPREEIDKYMMFVPKSKRKRDKDKQLVPYNQQRSLFCKQRLRGVLLIVFFFIPFWVFVCVWVFFVFLVTPVFVVFFVHGCPWYFILLLIAKVNHF
jgi:Flp pilus assembly protein TadB